MFSTHKNFRPSNPEIEKKIDSLISQLTLEEKIDLLSGHPREGRTKAVERVGIPAFKMADGPMGVHWWTDKSTSYPAEIMAAATWDTGLVEKMGQALGRDCVARGVH